MGDDPSVFDVGEDNWTWSPALPDPPTKTPGGKMPLGKQSRRTVERENRNPLGSVTRTEAAEPLSARVSKFFSLPRAASKAGSAAGMETRGGGGGEGDGGWARATLEVRAVFVCIMMVVVSMLLLVLVMVMAVVFFLLLEIEAEWASGGNEQRFPPQPISDSTDR